MDHSRRSFIRHGSLSVAGVSLGESAFSYLRNKPADTISVAVMGVRSRGRALAKAFAAAGDCEVSWICEVDDRYVSDALTTVAEHQQKVPKVEKDVRKVLEDPDLDALVIAAPDHWHAPAAIMACQAGKHVYIEKPCSHNPQEGEWLLEAVEKHKRVVQMGNQRRSWSNVVQAIQELHDGIIGDVYVANAWYANVRPSIGKGKVTAAPAELDFDLWQGPAPRRDYRSNIHPYEWHWFWHWGTGESLNNGTHFLDLMRWGLEVDFPTLVTSNGGRYHYDDDWETPDTQIITIDFPEKKTMTWESRSCNSMQRHGQSAGVTFHGTGGSMVIESGNAYTVYDNDRRPSVIKSVTEEDSQESQHDPQNTMGPGLRRDIGHVENFLDGIREGASLHSEIVGGHKSVLLCQLGNIAYRTGSALQIDPENGHIKENPEANALWSREYEPGWKPQI